MSNHRKFQHQPNPFVVLVSLLLLGIILYLCTADLFIVDEHTGITPNEVSTTSEPEVTVTPTLEATTTPIVSPTATPEPATKLVLHQIDVGCANAYLVQYGDATIFIDGGMRKSLKVVTSYLNNLGIERFDAYVATHWHGDHVDNMAELLDRYGDSETMVYGPSKTAGNRMIPNGTYVQFKEDDVLTFGEMKITCVGPYEIRQNGACNYDSLNFVIQYGDFDVLMTADYVHSKQVIERHGNLVANVEVLQMPHHGLDPLCITKEALRFTNPEVILVPANSSGPTNRVIEECNINCDIYDNKSDNVVIISDGTDYEVITHVVASALDF